MKNQTKKLSAVLIFFMAFNVAQAQKADKKECKEHRKHPSATELISKMDSDDDNRLTPNEVKGPLSDRFSEIDTNADGYLTVSELENAPKPDKGEGNRKRKRPSSEELISKMDENKDGKLALSEVKGPLADHFAEIDTNSDGYLTQVELDQTSKNGKGNRKKN